MGKTLTPPRSHEAGTTYEVRRAIKDYRCDSYPASDYPVIRKGDEYLLCTMFPSSSDYSYVDAATGKPWNKPVRMRICLADAPMWAREQLDPERLTQPRDS